MALTLTYAIVSNGVYSGLLGTLSKVTINTCSTIKSIFSHQNPDINNYLNKLDIKFSLEVIESALKKKYANYYNEIDIIGDFIFVDNNVENKEPLNDPEILCLHNLYRVILSIHTTLRQIDVKVEKHKLKWFVNWRHLNVINQLNKLESDTKLLDKRFCMLRKIINFMN